MAGRGGQLGAVTDAPGQHERHTGALAGLGQQRDPLARLDGADAQHGVGAEPVPGTDPLHLLGGGRAQLGGRGQVGHRGLAAEAGPHPLGTERADGHDRVGAAQRPRHEGLLAARAHPAVRPRHVEDREVVHRDDGGPAVPQRQVDVEPVQQAALRAGPQGQAEQRATSAIGDRVRGGHDAGRQLADGVALHVRDGAGGRAGTELHAQGTEELADVGLDTAASGAEGERLPVDGGRGRSRHSTTPRRSQK